MVSDQYSLLAVDQRPSFESVLGGEKNGNGTSRQCWAIQLFYCILAFLTLRYVETTRSTFHFNDNKI